MSAPLLETRALSVARRPGHPLVEELSIAVERGELVALCGPNGAGKSTLLLTLAGALTPSAGAVSLGGAPLASLGRRERARRVSMMTQRIDVSAEMTVEELCLLGRAPHMGLWGVPSRMDRDCCESSLKAVGLHGMKRRLLRTLSGGERQRAWFASLLSQASPLILLDEPFSAQDPDGVHAMFAALLAHTEGRGAAIVALHDLALVSRHFDRVWVLSDGALSFDGAPGAPEFEATLRSLYGEAVDVISTADGKVVLQGVPRV